MEKSGITNKKDLIFVFIGLATFLLSGYVLRGIHPPESIFYMFVIFGLLFGLGILVNKERSGDFVAKAFVISFVTLFLISGVFFAWSAHSHMYSKSINADRLDYIPEDFVVVTEEELNDYPALKEAIETPSYVKASPGDWRRTI
ncbi:hypothetical protein ACT9XH_04000 [Methanococcoides methylutens]|uniref:hypothetical protein n=1 Tax=Methanococcoides methylutens TaxID=2226 RepID=UPI0040449971